MIRRAIVTGATGFIGRNTLEPLHQLGFEVHVLGRQRPEAPDVTFHACDVLDTCAAAAAVRSISASHLLHLAWNVEPGKFWATPLNLDWVSASLGLLRAFTEAGGTRAVLAGTCAEYRWGDNLPLDELRSELAPGTLYGVAKDALRRIASAYADQTGLSLAWGRIFFMYGPEEKPGRLVSDAITSLKARRPFPTTDGTQRRDFMHVADVGRAFVELLASDVRGPVNIATGEAVRVRDVLETIVRHAGGAELLKLGERPRPADDPELIVALAQRLHNEVGFVPRYSLEEGVADTIKWSLQPRALPL